MPHTIVRKFRVRYADVAATAALVLATGGTAYAATALPRNSVGTAQLQAQAVTGKKVHDTAISGRKLRDDAVTTDKVLDGGIQQRDLAPGAVGTDQLADASITTVKIGAGQITEGHLFPGSVRAAAVADESLTLADLVGGDNTPLTAGIGMAPNECVQFSSLSVPGAVPGQVAVAGWLQAPPLGATISAVRVVGANSVSLAICNLTAANVSVPGGATFRIITFG
jgi:hypothetical protein